MKAFGNEAFIWIGRLPKPALASGQQDQRAQLCRIKTNMMQASDVVHKTAMAAALALANRRVGQ
jgi:hypothetical protein